MVERNAKVSESKPRRDMKYVPKPKLPLDNKAEKDGSLIVKSRDTVVVGCKLPNGLLLQLSYEKEESQPVMGGGLKIGKIYRKEGPKIRINGTAVPFGKSPNYLIAPGGYALTANVDREFFEHWLDQNKDADIVINELIFAHDTDLDVQAHARDNEKIMSGLEPIDPDKVTAENGLKVGKADLSDRSM